MAESHEALERFETAHEHGHAGGLARLAALTVAVVAAFLAIASFLGNESVKDAIQGQSKVTDANGNSQSFDTQTVVFQSDQLILTVFSISSDAKTAAGASGGLKVLTKLEKEVTQHQKELQTKLQEARDEVTHANRQHLRYEFAEVLLQVAIVLASVAIIASKRFLVYGAHLLGIAGIIFLALGYTI